MKSKKICPLATRIKKMMQTDDDVGKISQATPILIGRAMELFLEKICKQAIGVAQSRQAKTLTPSHLKAAVTADTTLDFLAELVASAPDLPPPDTEGTDGAPKAAKRRRGKNLGPKGAAAGAPLPAAVPGPTGPAVKLEPYAGLLPEGLQLPAAGKGEPDAMDVEGPGGHGAVGPSGQLPLELGHPLAGADAAAGREGGGSAPPPELQAQAAPGTAPTLSGGAEGGLQAGGSMLPQLGSSLGFIPGPSDMDDDYDDC
ncbi:hypothetical protein GPECTOR_26g511 [Gonium pectorale]|uniref:Transcription factor CBF/NF-Y/archaeal histone domain-containing protein n=1 Tax=Gonium pectorale TaxID=33097 RepID=A0A150GFJ3_GONPE|nr:hypothetical protein GPECTOR_26g511 [Gonium pectorale]|eukprot:KXZ48608.1 hypothetical protein GPECTOR_26g511 [Gonium pectorale]